MKRLIGRWALGVLALLLFSGALGPREIRLKNHAFLVEVVRTPEERARGLMGRRRLAPDAGMVFVFDPPEPVFFWMKNTRIPLDMLFIRNGRVLRVQHAALPCRREPCPLYPSGEAVDAVLELNGGTARRLGVLPGDWVDGLPSRDAGQLR